jgi:hypothetical protein
LDNLNQEEKHELLEIYNKFINLGEQDKSLILAYIQDLATKEENEKRS